MATNKRKSSAELIIYTEKMVRNVLDPIRVPIKYKFAKNTQLGTTIWLESDLMADGGYEFIKDKLFLPTLEQRENMRKALWNNLGEIDRYVVRQVIIDARGDIEILVTPYSARKDFNLETHFKI